MPKLTQIALKASFANPVAILTAAASISAF